jgi:hypothetical protein
MALKDKKSLYDRNTRNVLGDTVGTEPPSDGTYFRADGNTVSPFGVERGLKSDQMVELLNKSINTSTGNIYDPSILDRKDVGVDTDSNPRTPRQYINRLPE